MASLELNYRTCTGQSHSLALAKDGHVWAWGGNRFGQLGTRSAAGSRVPVPVLGLHDVIAVAAGWRQGLALRQDGTVWEWGATATPRPRPVPGLDAVVMIAAGGRHNLALRPHRQRLDLERKRLWPARRWRR